MCDIGTPHLTFIGSILWVDEVKLYVSNTLGALVVKLYTWGVPVTPYFAHGFQTQ